MHFYPFHALICQDVTAVFPDNISQEIGKLYTSANKPTGTPDVECADDGMYIGWRYISPASI